MPEYHVSRQKPWDSDPFIEIAIGRDNISPGCLVANTGWEGDYDNAAAAVDAALGLAALWADAQGNICISGGSSIGLYPHADDSLTNQQLQEWVAKRAAYDQPDDEIYSDWEDELIYGDGDV